MQNSITRRDFGKLALVGAGSLLLGGALTSVPERAHAANVVVINALSDISPKQNAAISVSRMSFDNYVVEHVSSPLVFPENSGTVRLDPSIALNRSSASGDNCLRVRYPRTVYYDGEWYDFVVDVEHYESYARESTFATASSDGYDPFYELDGWAFSHMKNFTGNGGGSTAATFRFRVCKRGTLETVPAVRYIVDLSDLDQGDKLNGGSDYTGLYAEGIQVLSGFEPERYVFPDTFVHDRGSDRWTGSQDTSSDVRSRLSLVATGDARFVWRGSSCGTLLNVRTTGSKIGAMTLRKVPAAPGLV